MADILHEEIFSLLNFRVQSCPIKSGGAVAPPAPLLLHHYYENQLKSPSYSCEQCDSFSSSGSAGHNQLHILHHLQLNVVQWGQ